MAETDHTGHASAGTGTDRLDEAAQRAKQKAGELWHGARESAQATLNERKDTAAQGLHDVAGALRDAARQQRQDGNGEAVAGLTGSAAEGLERLSNTLRHKDVGSMLRDVDRFAHRQPLAFFGLALAAGFATMRFLKASHDDGPAQPGQSDAAAENVPRTPHQTSSSATPY
jgi:hypothetical protein